MHDPLVVAFEIRRPWPKRVNWPHRRWYFPPLITVWHVEPKGRDSGEVCKHYTRVQDADGRWSYKLHHSWRFHAHHWKIQVHPVQKLRRWALTRCAWCGGRSTKRDGINVSNSWNTPRGRWWRGEKGLYHMDCSAIARAHKACTCEDPLTSQDGYGLCLLCGKGRSFRPNRRQLTVHRMLATIPAGGRDRSIYERVCALPEEDTEDA